METMSREHCRKREKKKAKLNIALENYLVNTSG